MSQIGGLPRKYASLSQGTDNGVVWPTIPVRLQARLTAEQVAAILGFSVNDIAVLLSIGLLKPLGKPTQQAVKHFASSYVEACAKNLNWLEDATQAVYDYHIAKNARKTINLAKQRPTEETAIAA